MTKRKSVVANFSAFSVAAQAPGMAEGAGSSEEVPQQVARVGAGVIGATQRTLTDIREERDRLRALVDAGGVLELNPSWIDPSPFPDRLPDDSDSGLKALRNLIAEEGQQVPIEVRPHPDVTGRYQIVYGHRRWRAARDLGRLVRATVASLSDRELVIAQGIENSSRQDLSWAEKALFAWRMERQEIKARDIRAALAIDDPELARYRAVCRALTAELIEAIGRAPKVGRTRWVDLANVVASSREAIGRIHAALAVANVSSSDERFRVAADAVRQPAEKDRTSVALKAPSGEVVGKALFGAGSVKLVVSQRKAVAFSAFVKKELPCLMDKFFAQTGET